MNVRIVIVDDHSIFRDGLRAVLDGRDGIEVVGDAGDSDTALHVIAASSPDVVLMDLHLPGLGGIATTRYLHDHAPHVRVLALSMLDDEATVLAALDAGARGYVTKSSPLAEVIRAIHAVHHGQLLLSGDVSDHLLHHTTTPPSSAHDPDGLTARERQLLPLLAQGATTERMATRLGISEKTVRNYLSTLYLKLGASDRATGALAARRRLDNTNP